MRISTGTLFNMGSTAITQQQESLLHSQQQVASGKRIITPSDDPAAASQILRINEAASLNKQYATNQGRATDSLSLTESTLGQVGSLLQDVRVAVINAGDPVLSNQDRASLATELQGRLDDLIGLANSTDGNGSYLFSGFQGNTQPFSKVGNSVSYNGDDGQRVIDVTNSRKIPVTENGSNIFERIKNGNGVFKTGVTSTNTGTGVIDGGQVTTPGNLTGHNYQVNFTITNGTTTYSVVDTTTGNPVNAPAATGNTYTAGTAISFDGLQFTIQGSPSNGDQFTVVPSSNQSMFTTLQNLITRLQTPITNATGRATLNNTLGESLRNLDQSIDKVLTVRTAAGARLQELDALSSTSSDLDIQYQAQISNLQDTDYAQSITELNKRQLGLQAAQQSFSNIAGKTLFDYL